MVLHNYRLRDEHAPEAIPPYPTGKVNGRRKARGTQRGHLGKTWGWEASAAEGQLHNKEGRNALRQCDPTTTERGGFEPPNGLSCRCKIRIYKPFSQ
jgi:hypothetical protein